MSTQVKAIHAKYCTNRQFNGTFGTFELSQIFAMLAAGCLPGQEDDYSSASRN